MPKKNFYSLCRYRDKVTKKLKAGYLPREGFDVPNDFHLDLAVYHSKEEDGSWYVVDTRTGLSVGQGYTRKEAVSSSLERLSTVDMDEYNKAAAKVAAQYGPCPGHGVTYNLVNN